MNAGDLEDLVMVQRHNEGTGDLHEVLDTWMDHCEAWCQVIVPSAKEMREGQDIQHNMIQIRMWPMDITHNDRIVLDGDVYHIEAIIDKKSYYHIKATMNEQGS